MTFEAAEAILSLTLLFGAFVNLGGAWGFLQNPAKAAAGLGLAVESEAAPKESAAALILVRLISVCLVALAMFYAVTALGPLQQPWNVVVAVISRLAGVVFYAATIIKTGGPLQFKKYVALNLGLAVSHAIFLVLTPGGLDALATTWSTFRWVGTGLS